MVTNEIRVTLLLACIIIGNMIYHCARVVKRFTSFMSVILDWGLLHYDYNKKRFGYLISRGFKLGRDLSAMLDVDNS